MGERFWSDNHYYPISHFEKTVRLAWFLKKKYRYDKVSDDCVLKWRQNEITWEKEVLIFFLSNDSKLYMIKLNIYSGYRNLRLKVSQWSFWAQNSPGTKKNRDLAMLKCESIFFFNHTYPDLSPLSTPLTIMECTYFPVRNTQSNL